MASPVEREMRPTSSKYRGERGLTLIEIAVAMMLIAILLAVAVPAFESASGADLRGGAAKLSAIARACYGEAGVKNVTLRLTYDIDHGAYWVEAYPGIYQIAGTDQDLERVREDEARKSEDEKRKKELESRYSERSAADAQSAAPAPQFVPVSLDFVDPDVLPRGLKFAGVRTPQFKQEIKKGKAYTHFFANGWAEHTLVYLEDAHGSFMTLETEPLSGHVVIWDGELDFKEIENRRAKGEEGG